MLDLIAMIALTGPCPPREILARSFDGTLLSPKNSVILVDNLDRTKIQIYQGSNTTIRIISKEFGTHIASFDSSLVSAREVLGGRIGQIGNSLSISFKFGETRDCFSNDDGRSEYTLEFSRGGVKKFKTTYDGCDPNTIEEQLGPR